MALVSKHKKKLLLGGDLITETLQAARKRAEDRKASKLETSAASQGINLDGTTVGLAGTLLTSAMTPKRMPGTYEEAQLNDFRGTVGQGISTGASLGTSIMPGIGTAVGAALGAGAGLLMAGKQKRDHNRAQDRAQLAYQKGIDPMLEANAVIGDQMFQESASSQMYEDGGKLHSYSRFGKKYYVDKATGRQLSQKEADAHELGVTVLPDTYTPSPAPRQQSVIQPETVALPPTPRRPTLYEQKIASDSNGIMQPVGALRTVEFNSPEEKAMYKENSPKLDLHKEFIAGGNVYFRDKPMPKGSLLVQTRRLESGGALTETNPNLSPDVSQVSSTGFQVNGKSHDQGGVDIPGTNAEVEKGETIEGDYVFSKKLGFADLHKRILKSKKIAESKGNNPISMATRRRLDMNTKLLQVQQEVVKAGGK